MKTMKRNAQFSLSAVLVSVLTFAACGSGEKGAIRTPKTVAGVEIETVRLRTSPVLIEAVGTVRSINTSILSAQMGGTVREMRVKAGDRVRRGEVLAILDDRNPMAQVSMAQAGVDEAEQGLVEIGHNLEAAQANLQFAAQTFRRYQGLLAKNSVSQQEFDDVQARYKAALANEQALEAKKRQIEAKQQQARSQQSSADTVLSYSRIVSPLNGVVTEKSVDAGTVVMPGMPLLTIEDASRYRLEVSVPEEYLNKVQLGQDLAVSVPDGSFQGRISEIVPAADPASRSFTVKVDLPKGCKCQPGEYGKASLPVSAEKSLVVPQAALLRRGELEGLFVVNPEGKLQFRLVKTGRVEGGNVEILSGLSSGEHVAVSQVGQLQDGERVAQQ
jgi:multidrug efflux system membrane fusion protein